MRDKFFNIIKILFIYFGIYFLCTVLFILMFHLNILKSLNVFMYKGIIFIVFTGIVAAILMNFVRRRHKKLFDVKDVILMFIGYCCVNMVLFTLIPVTVERSVSVFMLSYMESYSDELYSEEKMTKIFEDVYVDSFSAFKKRFHEQIVTGTIDEVNEDGYRINDKGKFIVHLFRRVAKWFNMDTKLVYPQYDDVD